MAVAKWGKTPPPSQDVGLCGGGAHLGFLMFRAQETGARHGHVYPEHTEEQQAADGPRRQHGLSWLGQVALGERGSLDCMPHPLDVPPNCLGRSPVNR